MGNRSGICRTVLATAARQRPALCEKLAGQFASLIGVLSLSVSSSVFAADIHNVGTPLQTTAPATPSLIAIVIDDLGDLREEGLRAVELPGPVTYAILPHTPHGPTLARLAHSLDKEVIVHLPMQALSTKPLGRGGLTADLTRPQFEQRTLAAIDSVPHAQGVSNHMGSRLTAMARPMQWLMDLLLARDSWLFLDSRTTAETIAELTARETGLPTTFRDVFLDNEVDVRAIRARFREAIAKAQTHGSAVAIGHPYPETLQVLAEELPHLVRHNRRDGAGSREVSNLTPAIELVPLSRLIATRARSAWRLAQATTAHAPH